MLINVVILVISHKHGLDYGLYLTIDEAWNALHDYVVQFWKEGEMGPRPDDVTAAIDNYFEYHLGNEWYEMPIRSLNLSGSNLRHSNEEEIQ